MTLKGYIAPLISIGAGILAASFGAPDLFKPAASDLTTFASFVVGSIVPTMILAATILRPARFTLKKFSSYREAVRVQLAYFFAMIVVAIALFGSVAIANIGEWKNRKIDIGHYQEFILSQGAFTNFLIAALSVFLFLRLFAFAQGIVSLFKLHTDMVEEEIKSNITVEVDRLFADEGNETDPRPNFGRVIQLPVTKGLGDRP